MADAGKKQILGRTAPDELIGRGDVFEQLFDHACRIDAENAIVLLAEPFSGSGELLRQIYDRLFNEGGEIIPFFFDLGNFRGDLSSAAMAFLRSCALQIVAFGHRDASLLNVPRDIGELLELASPADFELVAAFSAIEKRSDEGEFRCFSAPVTAAANGRRMAVLIAGAETLSEADNPLFEVFCSIYRDPRLRLILSGRRRAIHGKAALPTVELSALTGSESLKMVRSLAERRGVEMSDHIAELTAEMVCGLPALAASFLRGVGKHGVLSTYGHFAREYAHAICGGELSTIIEEALRDSVPEIELRARVLSILYAHLDVADGFVPMSFWLQHLKTTPDKAAKIVNSLNALEFVDVNNAGTRLCRDKHFLNGHLSAARELGRAGSRRAAVVGRIISDTIVRSPEILERAYRRRKALGIKELLECFASQSVSTALLDFRRFRNELRGAAIEEIERALKEDSEKLTLPSISFAANTAYFYPQFAELCDTERSAIGIGTSTSGNERAVWVAAEIDAKMEAGAEIAEFWCDRLEMAAANSGFDDITIWLIAREGFTDEALDVLDGRRAFGSSRRQAEMLRSMLSLKTKQAEPPPANEYKMTIPVGEETEVTAARAFEEAARRHDVPQKTVNQIKTALIEACINASEHSNSPDGKIELRFAFLEDRVDIEVANRGVRLSAEKADAAAAESRRGWGLRLMRGLMDNVDIESTEDRTVVRMSKYLGLQRS
jgi:serine/threonine-protein kinase RsbW